MAENVLTHGTGALNVDGCRIGTEIITAHGGGINGSGRTYGMGAGIPALEAGSNPHAGRWPANVILDESQAAELDRQSGEARSAGTYVKGSRGFHPDTGQRGDAPFGVDGLTSSTYADFGGASRFFYTPKASSDERPRVDGIAHPTVKPLDLMRYLVRLVTPLGGTVLEPFAGSGTTAEACVVEGFRCIAIEREADYLPLITARLSKPIEMTLL